MYRNAFYSQSEQMMYLFTWDEDGKRITKKVPYLPYFYIETAGEPDATSIFNTPLRKKEFATSFDRYKAYKESTIDRIFYNFSPDQQFLLDTFYNINDKDDFTKNPLKIFVIDIEVFSPHEFPQADVANHPVNLITIYDTLHDVYHVWGLENEYISKAENVKYYHCIDERALFIKFLRFWCDDHCDILTGWNIEGFDVPYIVNRIRKILGENGIKRLSPVNHVRSKEVLADFGKMVQKWIISGIQTIDYMHLYKKFSMGDRESYALNAIAKRELGDEEGKLDYNAVSLAELSSKDWQTYVDYNIQDVAIINKLEDKLQYLKIARMMCCLGCAQFEQALGKVNIIAGCLAVEALRNGKIVPSFKSSTREQYPGGFVRDPLPGLQEAVVSFDANSLYPSSIMALNISPETKVGKILDIDKEKDEITMITSNHKTQKLNHENFKKLVEAQKLSISKAGVLYTQKFDGISTQFVKKLYRQRFEIRDEIAELKKQEKTPELEKIINRKDIVQYSIKILLNSIYGVFANAGSIFCDTDNAASITLTGQAVVKEAGTIVDNFYKKVTKSENVDKPMVIYGDTDSVYLTIKPLLDHFNTKVMDEEGKLTKDASAICNKLDEFLNKEIVKWAIKELNSHNPVYKFKREVIASRAIFLKKKRYIAHVIDDEGRASNKFKYVGVDIAKSTISKEIKEIIKKVIESTILELDYGKSNKLLKEGYEAFKEINVDNLAYRVGLNNLDKYGSMRDHEFSVASRTPNQVKGALLYNDLLKSLKLDSKYPLNTSGTKIKKLYCRNNKYKIDTLCYPGEFPVELLEIIQVDYEKMYKLLIQPSIIAVYEAINWELPNVTDEVNTDLFDLFN